MRRLSGFAALAALGLATISPAAAQTTESGIESYFDHWEDHVRAAQESQPHWSSPLMTSTALLEQRLRFDTTFQRAGNGANTINLDSGKGLDLIVSGTQEIQIGAIPYVIRTRTRHGRVEGFNDWPLFRFKQRLASAPAGQGDYVVSAWIQTQQPLGIGALTNNAFTISPTLGFGKGWGAFDVQGTFGATIPTAYEDRLGSQISGNIAFQYHFLKVFWPEVELNWTYFPDGQRGGLNQLFLTTGVVIGRIPLNDHLRFTFGVGYQTALTPHFRASPLTPAYDHAWIISTRLSF